MKKAKKTSFIALGLLLVLLVSFSFASADDFTDYVRSGQVRAEVQKYYYGDATGMFYQAGGYFFKANPSAGDTVFDVTADLGRGGCGAFGFLSTLRSVFTKDALDNYLGSVASAALSSAPLLLLSYASPTMADVYKHLKVFAQAVARTRFASCEALEDLAIKAGAAARARSDAQYACLNQNGLV